MNQFCLGLLTYVALCTSGCNSGRSIQVHQKFPAEVLKKDYAGLRNALEDLHPSLYWYTPKDSMNLIFDEYFARINDSMTLRDFGFTILAPVTTAIRCGHTSFKYPPALNRKIRKQEEGTFPLVLKIWPDSMVVMQNLNTSDSLIAPGTVITSVNDRTLYQLTDTMFKSLPTDGYADNFNYIRLSAGFPYYYHNLLGDTESFKVEYLKNGQPEIAILPPYKKPKDSSSVDRKNEKFGLKDIRSMEFMMKDSLAVMHLNSFGGKGRLKAFYKRSFKTLRAKEIPNLVIDLRVNGGGKVDNYTALARYIKKSPFRVTDSSYAIKKGLRGYNRNISNGLINSITMFFVTTKRGDKYHFKYWENKTFSPRKKNHYNGRVFVLINGPTFSASSLFAHTVKGQDNVWLLGEETGGGWHGNSGLLIPDYIMPHTKMRVRMPLFRMVQYKHTPKNGRGVAPDIFVPPTRFNIENRIDGKMQKVMEVIRNPDLLQSH